MNVSGTRQSLPRSDILSGHGEAGLEVSRLGLEVGDEIRDKAAKLLSVYREDERGENGERTESERREHRRANRRENTEARKASQGASPGAGMGTPRDEGPER